MFQYIFICSRYFSRFTSSHIPMHTVFVFVLQYALDILTGRGRCAFARKCISECGRVCVCVCMCCHTSWSVDNRFSKRFWLAICYMRLQVVTYEYWAELNSAKHKVWMEKRLHSVEHWIASDDVEFHLSVSTERFSALTFGHLLNKLQKCYCISVNISEVALSYVLAFLIVNCIFKWWGIRKNRISDACLSTQGNITHSGFSFVQTTAQQKCRRRCHPFSINNRFWIMVQKWKK